MKQVCRDDVFIGDRGDALDCLTQAQGKGKGIRQILTIDCEPLRQPLGSNSAKVNGDILLKHVECLDEPEADLLSHLDNCIGSIQEGLKKGKVLVHCFAGVSRSATVILAFLMQTQNIELKKAFEDLKAVYPKADPNPGFLYQLQLFEAMGKRVDTASSLYKQFRLQIIARRLEKTGGKQLPDGILESFAHNPERSVVDSKQNVYKCRKCRYQLFQTTNCLQHIPGTGQAFLPWYSKSLIQEDQKVSRSNCTSYFIEPVKWMMPLLVATAEGKLSCPKCSGRIGSFNWAGEQCSCGRWVTPAFQLHKSRIDER